MDLHANGQSSGVSGSVSSGHFESSGSFFSVSGSGSGVVQSEATVPLLSFSSRKHIHR